MAKPVWFEVRGAKAKELAEICGYGYSSVRIAPVGGNPDQYTDWELCILSHKDVTVAQFHQKVQV